MAQRMSLQDFKACCRAGITRDNQLVVACRLANGQKFSRSIALTPLIERVKAMIADYHRRVLHGRMDDTTISGLGDWFNSAVDAVKSVAHSQAVKDIYHAIDEHKKEIAMGVASAAGGPAAAMQVNQAFTAYDQMMKAKGGDPAAAQQITNVKDAAADGNPKAQDLMSMMQAMLNMMKMKDAKAAASPGTSVSGKHTGRRGGWGKTTATGAKPGDRKAIHLTQQDPNNRGSVDKWGAPPPPSGSSDGSGSGSSDDGGDDDGDDDQDQDMSGNHGWWFNRPYRTQATSFGPALRTLYALGAG